MPRPMPLPAYWIMYRTASKIAKPATIMANVHAQGWRDHRPNEASSQAMPPAIISQPQRPA